MGDAHRDGQLGTSFYLALDIDNDLIADVFVEANIKATTPFVAFHISDPDKEGTGPSNTGWEIISLIQILKEKLDARNSFITAYDSTTDLDSRQTDSWIEFDLLKNPSRALLGCIIRDFTSGDSTLACIPLHPLPKQPMEISEG